MKKKFFATVSGDVEAPGTDEMTKEHSERYIRSAITDALLSNGLGTVKVNGVLDITIDPHSDPEC